MTTKNPAAVALGRLGGLVKSPRKAAAARKNGQKGGWPRGTPRKAKPMNLEPMDIDVEVRDSKGRRVDVGPITADRGRGTLYITSPPLTETYSVRATIKTARANGRKAAAKAKGKKR